MTHTYEYPRPAYTSDVVVFNEESEIPSVLLIRRGKKEDPFFQTWALPGGHVEENETVLDSAVRELLEETQSDEDIENIDIDFMKNSLQMVGVFDRPGRDPRGWYVSVAFFVLASFEDFPEVQTENNDEVSEIKWFKITELPPLAFDHASIICKACIELTKFKERK
jgi:8-oxo-dGTP diphosphatase